MKNINQVTYIRGDNTNIHHVDAIAHQTNCLTVRAHGLSATINRKYPWADIYSRRTPIGNRNLATIETRGIQGTVEIFADGFGFHVVYMMAQWKYWTTLSIM